MDYVAVKVLENIMKNNWQDALKYCRDLLEDTAMFFNPPNY